MGWCWCCWRRTEEEEDQREPLAVPSPQETSNGTSEVESEQEMGQTASQIVNKLLPSKPSPTKSDEQAVNVTDARETKGEEELTVEDDVPTAELASASISSVPSSPKAPLATPRKPLRSGSVTRTLSEVSLTKTEPKRLKGDVKFLNYPFLLDKETINYIQNSKVMFIMKGLPGSGKSTVVKNIQMLYQDVVTCSADFYFMRNGKYNFQPEGLKNAHEACQEEATQAASSGMNVIIIDNTNVRNWEMKFYLDLAKEYHYIPVIVKPQTPWCFDARELAKRNSHDVEEDIIKKKVKSFQDVLPIYYGWFLNEADTHSILKIGKEWLRHALQIKEFFKSFSKMSGFSSAEELLGYFSRSSFAHPGSVLHCTSKFSAKGKIEGGMEYIKDPKIIESQGQVFALDIIGYIFTPFTMGARIRLSSDMLELWGQDDYEELTDISKVTSKRKEGENVESHDTWDWEDITVLADSCQNTVMSVPQDLTDRFCPVKGEGCRAHFTLGCAEGTKPVRTGFDIMKVISLEQEAESKGFGTSSASEKSFNLPGGVLRTYGDGFWVVYPENKLVVNGIFSSYS